MEMLGLGVQGCGGGGRVVGARVCEPEEGQVAVNVTLWLWTPGALNKSLSFIFMFSFCPCSGGEPFWHPTLEVRQVYL